MKQTTDNKIVKVSKNPFVKIDKLFYPKYNRLANPQSSRNKGEKEAFFARMVDLFMYSAVHGYRNDLYKPFDKKSKTEDLFKFSTFDSEKDLFILKSIALLHIVRMGNEDPSILSDITEIKNIIECYANGGFCDLMNKIDTITIEHDIIQLLSEK